MLKNTLPLLIIILVGSCQNTVSEIFVLDLEKKRFNAMTEGDVDLLDQLISDDLYYIHSNGKVDTKDTFIGGIKDGTSKYGNILLEESKTRIYGDAAIINGICTYENKKPDGSPNNLQLKYTSVYANSDGNWKFVSWQSFRMSP
ncbi:nuclear transport factor 2 family protein [Algoriphagus persicinus]|uniref:nuclear transport factor 2 family protein n=1 Tax=Algoriphagus persicinus TaxID=3108754 RepID=UPI002B3AA3C7|nr:nuclear transport factor 2 family protein [Algoriphagus sp. E1-3-M2]MEB2787319.1 nuclear transport factor 2 family protein [Algoriphagus sp. E1-3-M2]